MIITTASRLAVLLRDKRKALGLSQQETAKRVGIKQDTVSALETKPEHAKLSTLFKVLSALELNIELSDRGVGINDTEHEW